MTYCNKGELEWNYQVMSREKCGDVLCVAAKNRGEGVVTYLFLLGILM